MFRRRSTSASGLIRLLVAGTVLQVPLADCATFGPSPFGGNIPETTCFDFWSIVHFYSGYLIGGRLGSDRLADSAGLLILYEGAEPLFWPGFAENDLNQNCDVVIGTLGAAAAHGRGD